MRGKESVHATFTVTAVAPTCTLSANQPTITVGQSSTLTWTTANNPTSASIADNDGNPANDIGPVNPTDGATGRLVSPTVNTTYTLTVTNTAGSNNCSATVTVNPAPALTWTQKFPLNAPSPRVGSAIVYDAARNQVVLFGGSGSNGYLDDTWTWDGTNWTQKFPANKPAVRANHGIAYDAARQQIVLFGGEDSSGGFQLNDTWLWD